MTKEKEIIFDEKLYKINLKENNFKSEDELSKEDIEDLKKEGLI